MKRRETLTDKQRTVLARAVTNTGDIGIIAKFLNDFTYSDSAGGVDISKYTIGESAEQHDREMTEYEESYKRGFMSMFQRKDWKPPQPG